GQDMPPNDGPQLVPPPSPPTAPAAAPVPKPSGWRPRVSKGAPASPSNVAPETNPPSSLKRRTVISSPGITPAGPAKGEDSPGSGLVPASAKKQMGGPTPLPNGPTAEPEMTASAVQQGEDKPRGQPEQRAILGAARAAAQGDLRAAVSRF